MNLELIANYPFEASALSAHCGKTVLAITHHGDIISGVFDRVEGEQMFFRRLNAEPVEVQNYRKKRPAKAKVKVFPFYGPNPGLEFALPLFLLAALFLIAI